MNFNLSDVASAAGSALPAGTSDLELSGVAVDSRAVRAGALFVAVRGARADGLDFATDAVAHGARAILASRVPVLLPERFPVVVAPEPAEALTTLATFLRKRAGFRLAAITGSSGKTTTKEFTAAILSRRCAVERTPQNPRHNEPYS